MMKVFVCIVPDNELLGVFTTREKADEAIRKVAEGSSFVAAMGVEAEEAELDSIVTHRIFDRF